MKTLVLTTVVLCASVPAYGTGTEYELFAPSRDWSNYAADGTGFVNGGGRPQHRAYKWSWQEGIVMDWDPQPILDWMAAQLTPGFWFTLQLKISSSGWDAGWPEGVSPSPLRYQVRTLNLQQDWAEGDGTRFYDFNWSKDTAAATNFYAQTRYTDTDGIPGSGDEVLDVANCVPWAGWTGNTVSTFRNSQADLFRHVNGVYDMNQNGVIDPDEDEPIYLEIPDVANQVGSYVSVELQHDPYYPAGGEHPPIVNDLLFNEHNRGIALGPCEYYDEQSQSWIDLEGLSLQFYTIEQNPGDEPKLRVEMIPPPVLIPGDTQPDFCVDGLDYNIWSLHYLECGHPPWSAGGYTVGNFNEDDCVDGLDYNIWSLNYLAGCDGAEAPIPEPASALLLIAALGPVLWRRANR